MFIGLLVWGCVNAEKDLGEVDADLGELAESEALAHVGAAMGGGAVLDLFDEPVFTEAPDPSALFAARHARHADVGEVTGAPLRVLSYNAGLLSRSYLGGKVAVPHIEERRAVMGERLFSGGWDVLLLQETWEWEDVEALEQAALAAGYVVFAGTKPRHEEHGLTIAVRADLVAGEETEERQYVAQWKLEHFPGPNLKRGWLMWSLDVGGRRVHLVNTHLTPFAEEWPTRDLQVRELGLRVADLPADDVVIVAGDLNTGWYYAEDTWVDAEGAEIPDFWANAIGVPLLMHYGELDDVPNAASPNQDVVLGDLVPLGNGEAMLDDPLGDPGYCAATPHVAFTATDCNTLHFESYAGEEFPARLDHLLWRGDRVKVGAASLAWTEPLDFGGERYELSDHYGVQAELVIGQ